MAEEWDLSEITKLVEKSGRPLEVRCGMAFLKEEWSVSHSTYYKDVIDGSAREVDIIAGKKKMVEGSGKSVSCRLGVFVSCKGFSPDQMPVSFSLGNSKFPDYMPPSLLSSGIPMDLDTHAFHQARLARDLVFSSGELDHARRLVAFDVIEKRYPNKGQKPAKDRGNQSPIVPEVVNYARMGDNALYEGLESAVKSAMYWQKINTISGLHIRIPVLLTSKDWLDYPIDDGVLGKPCWTSTGFKSTLYPSAVTSKSEVDWVTSLVWSESKLPALIALLNKVFGNLVDEVEDDLLHGKYGG